MIRRCFQTVHKQEGERERERARERERDREREREIERERETEGGREGGREPPLCSRTNIFKRVRHGFAHPNLVKRNTKEEMCVWDSALRKEKHVE